MTTEPKQNELNDEPQNADIDSKAEEYLNNWKKERADFINYKKDEERRISEIAKYSCEGMIMEIIEVMDDFITTLKHGPKEAKDKFKDWYEGLEQAIRNFDKLMKGYGVERIKVEGEKFDPMVHEAVGMPEKDGQRLEEVRAGYKMHDKIIRPARVKIIK
jgi:molecular chaperone GrpE